jgi:hypothetical protein
MLSSRTRRYSVRACLCRRVRDCFTDNLSGRRRGAGEQSVDGTSLKDCTLGSEDPGLGDLEFQLTLVDMGVK